MNSQSTIIPHANMRYGMAYKICVVTGTRADYGPLSWKYANGNNQ